MQRYSLQQQIGEGTFGTVFCAINKESGEKFAIKSLKKAVDTWEEASIIREVQAASALCRNNRHLVQVHEVIRESDATLYFVCEMMPGGNLNDLMEKTVKQGQTLNSSVIRSIVFQVIQGLEHIHSKGYMHRDLKPENLLLRQTDDKGMVCKVADFSLARTGTINTTGMVVAGENKKMTSYVSTRWYRAPEIILSDPHYSTEVDMWATACIMAELYRLYPLFPGSGEIDQLQRILNLMGNLEEQWKEGVLLSRRFGLSENPPEENELSNTAMERLQAEIPTACHTAIDFVDKILQLDPKRRLSATGALRHVFLAEEVLGGGVGRVVSPTKTKMREAKRHDTKRTPINKTVIYTSGTHSCERPPYVSVSPRLRIPMMTKSPELEFAMHPIQLNAFGAGEVISNDRLNEHAQIRSHDDVEKYISNSRRSHHVLAGEDHATGSSGSHSKLEKKRARMPSYHHRGSDFFEYRPAKAFNID